MARKQILSELETKKALVQDLQGISRSYIGYIHATINDLKEVNAQIDTEIQSTEALINEYRKTVTNLSDLKDHNFDLIADLQKAFEGEKE